MARLGARTLDGTRSVGRRSRVDARFRTSASISCSISITLKTRPDVGSTITDTPLVKVTPSNRADRVFQARPQYMQSRAANPPYSAGKARLWSGKLDLSHCRELCPLHDLSILGGSIVLDDLDCSFHSFKRMKILPVADVQLRRTALIGATVQGAALRASSGRPQTGSHRSPRT